MARRRALSRQAAAVLAAFAAAQLAAAAEPRNPPLAEVRSGVFEVIIVEQAELAARRSVTIASDLPSNTAKVAWLVPDGASVAAGDLLVRFDAEPFQEEAARAQREHADARAILLQAEAELQVLVRRGAELDEALAHQIELARLKLDQFRKADRVLRIAKAANDVLAARTAVEAAALETETQRRLAAEGLGSALLLKQAESAEREQRDALAVLERTARLLEEVILPNEEREAVLELERKERERAAAQQAQVYALAKQHAAIMGAESRVAAHAAALERARTRLERMDIRAPVAGFAVHVPTSVGNAFRKVQVGDSVWERHGFIVIPDMSALVAELDVREIDVGKIEPGQSVTLFPEAYPDVTLTGRIESVGTLAERASADAANEFSVRVVIDSGDARLRPGMRARAEIHARRFDNVLHVPVEAVFRDRGEWVAFVWNGRAAQRRPVALGDSDGAYVVVTSGVERGEKVLLAYPGGLASPE